MIVVIIVAWTWVNPHGPARWCYIVVLTASRAYIPARWWLIGTNSSMLMSPGSGSLWNPPAKQQQAAGAAAAATGILGKSSESHPAAEMSARIKSCLPQQQERQKYAWASPTWAAATEMIRALLTKQRQQPAISRQQQHGQQQQQQKRVDIPWLTGIHYWNMNRLCFRSRRCAHAMT